MKNTSILHKNAGKQCFPCCQEQTRYTLCN